MARHRPTVDITPAERIAGVVIGAMAVVVAVALLGAAGSVVAVVLELLLVAVGLDLVVTGRLGHRPRYEKLGHVPRSVRGRS